MFVPYIFKLSHVNISIDEISITFDQDFGSRGQVCSLPLTLDQVITGCSYNREQTICHYTLDFISYKHTCYHSPSYIGMHALLITRYTYVMLIYNSRSLLYYCPKMPHVHMNSSKWPLFSMGKLETDTCLHMYWPWKLFQGETIPEHLWLLSM